MSSLEAVREFHETFGVKIEPTPFIGSEVAKLRIKLLREELKELEDAIEICSIPLILDALTDLQYILDGTYLSFGLHTYKELAFHEVHCSNMSKLGEDGNPIRREDGKILKGPNYVPPDIEGVLAGVKYRE